MKACANFDYFLKNNDQENKDGPFLSGINRMINEEKLICEREQSHHLKKNYIVDWKNQKNDIIMI